MSLIPGAAVEEKDRADCVFEHELCVDEVERDPFSIRHPSELGRPVSSFPEVDYPTFKKLDWTDVMGRLECLARNPCIVKNFVVTCMPCGPSLRRGRIGVGGT